MSTLKSRQDDDWADLDRQISWRRILKSYKAGQSTQRRFLGRRTGLVNDSVEKLGGVLLAELSDVGCELLKCSEGSADQMGVELRVRRRGGEIGWTVDWRLLMAISFEYRNG